jgi:hypothetical protein
MGRETDGHRCFFDSGNDVLDECVAREDLLVWGAGGDGEGEDFVQEGVKLCGTLNVFRCLGWRLLL